MPPASGTRISRAQQLRHGLEMMLRVRHFDARMIAMHRQGRVSFHVTSRGEEATRGGRRDGVRAPRLAVSQLSAAGVDAGPRHADGGHDVPDHRQSLRSHAGPTDAGALQLAGRERGFDFEPRRHAVAAGGRRGDGVCVSRRAACGRRLERRRHRGPRRLPSRAQLRFGLSAAMRAARGRQPMGDQHPSFAGHRRPHVRRAGRCLQPAGLARRRQRLPRGVRGRAMGDRTGPPRRRTFARRAGHLSLRRPLDERRHQPISRRRTNPPAGPAAIRSSDSSGTRSAWANGPKKPTRNSTRRSNKKRSPPSSTPSRTARSRTRASSRRSRCSKTCT